MRRATVLALVLAVVATTPSADARKQHRKRHHRHGLHAQVHRSRGHAPKHWSLVSGWAVPPPVATPLAPPVATPVAAPVSTPPPAPTATPGSTLPPPDPHSVSVGSTEFAFTLSQSTVAAGQVRVQFDNSRAEDPHQLDIAGQDPDFWDFGVQGPGVVTQRTITLRPGTYTLFCPLPGHEALGMRATLKVR